MKIFTEKIHRKKNHTKSDHTKMKILGKIPLMTTFTNYDIHICSLRLPIYPYMLSP